MARGRVGQAAAEKAAAEPKPPPKRNGYHHIGSGPPCPDGHGPLYDWGMGRFYCSHSGHGGNGKFFTAEEVN